MKKTKTPIPLLVVGLDRKVIQLCREKGTTSIKDCELLALIQGNVMTAERRASRRLAKLAKMGYLQRKKICLEASVHDGTPWVYAYEAV